MHINFAPKKKFEFRKFRLDRLNMMIIAGCILFFMIAFGSCQKVRLSLLESKKTRLETVGGEMKQKAAEKGVNVSQSAGKMPAIKSYENRMLWSKVLYRSTAAVPSNIWLNSFNGIGKDRKIQIAGESPNHPSVAVLAEALSKVDMLSDVALLSSDMSVENNITKIKFQIECKLK